LTAAFQLATGQEQEAKEVLNQLDKLDAGQAEFETLLTEFITAGRSTVEQGGVGEGSPE
jgi:hypothetical protein